ncbi:MAG: hypothetical protein ACK5DE_08695 [Bacteroidota bacterium]|jgi:hypothetical protein
MPLTTLYGDGTRVIGDINTFIPERLHPQVANYISRLSTAGYNPSVNEITAINNLIWSMVTTGIYAKCDLIYPVIGSSTSTVGFDLKNTFNATFSGSWTVASTGMRPTTANTANRADTGWNPNLYGSGTNDHLAAYFRTTTTTSNVPIGASDGVNFFQMNAISGINAGNMVINNTVAGIMRMTLTTAAGYWIGTRISSTNSKAFVDGIERSSTTNSTANRPNFSVALGCRRTGTSTYDQPSTTEMAYISIGDGLTPEEVRLYNIMVQSYQQRLGRQV